MKVLLDSHAVLWAVDDPARLGPDATRILGDEANELFISAATVWELSIKVSLGKLVLSLPFRQWMETALADLGAAILPITIVAADAAANLPRHHGDPFDRMIVGQCVIERVGIVSSDTTLDRYGITRIW